MPQVRTGVFTDGPNKGRRWEIYQDDRSPTGWVRKIVDPYRPGTEYFEDFNAAAADVDEQQAAAAQAAQQAQVQQTQRSQGAYWGRIGDEDARRWDLTDQRAERESQVGIADKQARLRLAQQAFDEDRRQNDRNFGLSVARLQNDELATGANMRGALSWIQGDSYAQGTANGVSPYLQSLKNGTNVAYGGGTATDGNPTPLTVSTLRGAMGQRGGYGYGSGSGGYDQYGRPKLSSDAQSFVDAVDKTARGGLANQGLGWYESQTKGQQDAYRSASDYLGRDTDSELSYYQRSRPRQSSALRG